MAGVSNDAGGFRRITFAGADGRQKVLRLGRVTRKQAEAVRGHVEKLLHAVLTDTAPPDETSRWVAGRPARFRKRLAAAPAFAPTGAAEPAPDT